MSHRCSIWVICSVASGVTACSAAPSLQVRPGIDVLVTDSIHLVRGMRVGLLTNQTGVARDGTGDVERLLGAGVQLTALFSPEHGFRGVLDRADIGHAVDSATGLPIYSLYGAVRAPTPEMLQAVDIMLVDLQDIGARPYTYVSTALLTLEAVGALNRPVVILDRPNPIGGGLVQGPVLDTAFASFIGMLPIPLRHGMSLGELVRFGNSALGIDAELRVVPAAGWRRAEWFDQTGLPWIRPSPNMPDLESAAHYPGLVLFESTNVSVGRGTPVAFQVLGAPWLLPERVLAVLGEVPGAFVRDTTVRPVRPSDGKYDGLSLPALRLAVTDRTIYDPTRVGIALLDAIHRVHADSLVVRAEGLAQRLGLAETWAQIQQERDLDEIWASWEPDRTGFVRRRRDYLLYP